MGAVAATTPPAAAREPARVVIVMGVSGSGKTTTAIRLAGALGWDFFEGDDLHPAANIMRMAGGEPLGDEDRREWLGAIASLVETRLEHGLPAVITCSALRRAYRDVLRRPGVLFVHLHGTQRMIERRLAARTGHFMPPALLLSQLEILEPPAPDEVAMSIDAALPPDRQVAELLGSAALDGASTRGSN